MIYDDTLRTEAKCLRRDVKDLTEEAEFWKALYLKEAKLADSYLVKLWGIEGVLLLHQDVPQALICEKTLRFSNEHGKCPVHEGDECLRLYLWHEKLVKAMDEYLHPKEL